LISIRPAQCRTGCSQWEGGYLANYGLNGQLRTITQKRIWHRIGVPESLYLSDLAALTVVGNASNVPQIITGQHGQVLWSPKTNLNWNQSSDRAVPHIQVVNVPSRGNSTRTTLTRNRPGASTPGGRGVDIKHGSYARYLAKKKAGNVVTRPNNQPITITSTNPPTFTGLDGFDATLQPQLQNNPKITKGNKLGSFGIVTVSSKHPCPCLPQKNS
jgi:hypothetical protein